MFFLILAPCLAPGAQETYDEYGVFPEKTARPASKTSTEHFVQDFKEATRLSRYQGLDDIQTAELLVNATEALHRENMEILRLLEELKGRIEILERSVEKIERKL